jgi:putative inorganic carbon (HCO3(-)) transporter
MAGVMQPATAARRPRQVASTGFLFGWLLLVFFLDYGRPTNQLTFLASVPLFYSLPPFLLFAVTLFAGGMRPAKDIFADKFPKWLLIFLVVVMISVALAGFSRDAQDVMYRVIGYTVLFFMIARLVTTEGRILGVIVMLVITHLYLLAVNFNVLTDPSTRQYITGAPFLGDGNDFSLSIVWLFPALVGIGLLAKSKPGKYLAFAAAGVIPLSIVASQSRGGTLGLAAALGYLWWRSSKKSTAMIAVAAVVGIVLVYAPSAYFGRMSTLSNAHADSSAQGRLDAWSASIGMGLKNPLGIGAGNFGARWGRTAHSTYFLALGELGILGFACVVVLIFGGIRANLKLHRELGRQVGPDPPEPAKRALKVLDMLNAALVSFAVSSAFLSATYYPHIFVLTGLLVAAREFARKRCAEAGSAVPPPAAAPVKRFFTPRVAHG